MLWALRKELKVVSAENEDTGFAYVVGSNRAGGGLHMINIQDPANPFVAGNFSADGYTHDAQVVSYNGADATYVGREIAFAANEDTLTIIDVTNKSNPAQLSRQFYSSTGYAHQGWLSEDHNYFFLGDELDEFYFGGRTKTHVFDVSNGKVVRFREFLCHWLGDEKAPAMSW